MRKPGSAGCLSRVLSSILIWKVLSWVGVRYHSLSFYLHIESWAWHDAEKKKKAPELEYMTKLPGSTLPLTVCSWVCSFVNLSSMIWTSNPLSENIRERILISDHVTQQDTKIILLAIILAFRWRSWGKLPLSKGYALLVQLYHTADRCHNAKIYIHVSTMWAHRN